MSIWHENPVLLLYWAHLKTSYSLVEWGDIFMNDRRIDSPIFYAVSIIYKYGSYTKYPGLPKRWT